MLEDQRVVLKQTFQFRSNVFFHRTIEGFHKLLTSRGSPKDSSCSDYRHLWRNGSEKIRARGDNREVCIMNSAADSVPVSSA
ncbi:hypothetical protein RRG08_058462 [Elysia crispata]|uniref:Uncharacterized protein n=1 Tax=Elysia crispata TaxID=231223 RepID=A0AAE0Y634_9GAST|nr:hypothetical protein RRG08_058462 [Elysia crispata]